MSEIPEEANEENTSNLKENSKFSMTAMPEIPEEIIKEIIFLLPVKSLLKFRCVGPSWLSFIDSPYCIKTHSSKSRPKIILNTPDGLFALDINPKNPKPRAETSVLTDFPRPTTYYLGSCSGVLLSDHHVMAMSLKDSTDVVLQNPYTRTFHKIPFLDPKWPGPKNMYCVPEKLMFALWYDDLTDEYKVFRNCQFYGCMLVELPFFSEVNVYSLKMQSYKQIDPFPYYMKYARAETVFVGGALHWVVSTAEWDKSQLIASFDVATEKYGLVGQPVYSIGDFKLFLHVLGACLSVGYYYSDGHKEVWGMKEYGDVDSWTKILTLCAANIGVESLGYLKPLFYSECGKKVLIVRDRRTLLLYDLEEKSAEFVELDKNQVPGQFQAFVHMESLVKLSGNVPGDAKKGAEDNDKNNNKKRDDFLSKGFKRKFL